MSSPSVSSLPVSLQRLVDRLADGLDARGELSGDFRWGLHQAIEAESASLHERAAYFRRCKLGLAAAYRVLALWPEAGRRQVDVEPLLALACDALHGRERLQTLQVQAERTFVQLLEVTGDDEALQLPGAAAFAACAAAEVVVYDMDLALLTADLGEVPPEQWDPALLASMAWAGGAPWNEGSDDERRRAFWRWYLQRALPTIWSPRRQAGAIED